MKTQKIRRRKKNKIKVRKIKLTKNNFDIFDKSSTTFRLLLFFLFETIFNTIGRKCPERKERKKKKTLSSLSKFPDGTF